jgi:hypothetical protein
MVKVKVTDNYDVCCEVEVAENSDWDYARNKHILVRDNLLEYSTSSFDAPILTSLGLMHGGNRDFPWQGLLLGPVNNALYKVLDALYYRTLDAENLKPALVVSGCSSADYIYVDEEGEHYRMHISVETGRERCVFYAYSPRPSIFLPIFDMRNAESDMEPNYIIRCMEGNMLVVESTATPLKLEITGFDEIRKMDLTLDWVYKLDDGFRKIVDGKVVFVKYRRRIQAPVALISRKGIFAASIPLPTPKAGIVEVKFGIRENIRRLHWVLRKLNPKLSPQIIDAILLRIDRLMSFGITLDALFAPEAGAMWFKRVWVRDMLEGLRWNMLTYVGLFGLSKWLISLMRDLIKIAYENNGLRVFLEGGDYVSDAIPQLINVVTLLYDMTHEEILLRESIKLMLKACEMLRSGKDFSGCNLHDGLIVCRANSSWIDVLYPFNGVKWPTRLPLDWMGKVPPDDKFALIEVNSLFLECLHNLVKSIEKAGNKPPKEFHDFISELLYSYKKWFLLDNNLPPITIDPMGGLRDDTKSSLGVIALTSLKGILYDRRRLENIWSDVEQLLVKRKLVELGNNYEIFGLLVRKVDEKPYLGDLEYHGAVVWPRDTPYLIEVMRALSMETYGVLINNLDHMISEGAVGYVNELFSLPVGQNPSPMRDWSFNPVPVKNYAQYWSHWCDPYINYFLGEKF